MILMLNRLSTEQIDIIRGVKIIFFDFDGIFTDNTVLVSEDGKESVRCSRSDGLGLKKLRDNDIASFVISTEVNKVVSVRCKKMKIPCIHGTEDKFTILKEIISEKGMSLGQTAFVGNDINDLECLANVAMPIAVADAYPEVKKIAKIVTVRKGGNGAVREVCDLFDSLHKKH